MRMMFRVSMPAAKGNAAIKSGAMQRVLKDTHKPEAAYFTADHGHRTAYFFVDMPDVSYMPVMAEPAFQELDATVEFIPVMTAEDLARGLANAKF